MSTVDITPNTIRVAAMNLLSMREHSAHELHTKLTKKFPDSDFIQDVVEQLQREGLQSDSRYAEAFIRMRQRQGKGALIIKMELANKGIASHIITGYMPEVEDWDALALKAYVKKFGEQDAPDLKEKSKRSRFLAARGFSSSNIQSVFHYLKTNAESV